MSRKQLYLLLDSRAGLLIMGTGIMNMNDADECWDRYILIASKNPKEICDYANNENYGKNCIVADINGRVYWEWLSTGSWKPKTVTNGTK